MIDRDVHGYSCPVVGVKLTHTEKLLIKLLKFARENGALEAESDEGPRE